LDEVLIHDRKNNDQMPTIKLVRDDLMSEVLEYMMTEERDPSFAYEDDAEFNNVAFCKEKYDFRNYTSVD
jgi:septum formation topological specificity factor MinE